LNDTVFGSAVSYLGDVYLYCVLFHLIFGVPKQQRWKPRPDYLYGVCRTIYICYNTKPVANPAMNDYEIADLWNPFENGSPLGNVFLYLPIAWGRHFGPSNVSAKGSNS
jgi:hypothetical protein